MAVDRCLNVIPARVSHPAVWATNAPRRVQITTYLLQTLTMSPKHAQSMQKSIEQEGRILLAIKDIQNGSTNSIRQIAERFCIPRSTLQRRLDGQQFRADTRPSGHKLTQTEEESLVQYILDMDMRGSAPRPAAVQEMANILLAERGSSPPSSVGKNWSSAFVKRRPELRTRYSKRYDYQRAQNEDPKILQEWFTTVQCMVDENGIQPEDIYNFDETGFAMGLISTAKVITRAEYYSRRALLQPGNREWVTVIESISASGFVLPPCIIFKGKNYIESWFDDLPGDWRFEVSPNGWTSDEIGLRWLQRLFIPATSMRTKGKYRLLILDGHGSHLTPQFDRLCAENAIIPLCMPAHSSHLLQPLDVGCFATIKRSYGRLVENQARTGHNHIDKLDFLAAYPQARIETFKPETIRNSFAAAGLVPINADRVLSKLNILLHTPTPPGSRPSSRSSNFSPKTPKTVKQLEKQASSLKVLLRRHSRSPPNPSKTMLDQIIKGCYLSMHNAALLAQENTNLRAMNEKKRQKRTRSNRQISREEGLTVDEASQLIQRPIQPVEHVEPPPPRPVEQPILPSSTVKRAPPKCSGCGNIGHSITRCPNR